MIDREQIRRFLIDNELEGWADSAEHLAGCEKLIEALGEPTEAMIVEGIIERHDSGVPEAWSLATANIYRTMFAARFPPHDREG